VKKTSLIIATALTLSANLVLAASENSGGLGDLQSSVLANTATINSNTNAINALSQVSHPATYDFKDYATTTVSTKVYKLQGDSFCGNTETRRIIPTSIGYDVERTRTGISVCHNKTFHYSADANSKSLISKDNNDMLGQTLSTDSLKKPVTLMTSNMTEGNAFGSATELFRGAARTGIFINTTTVLNAGTAKTPLQTFTDCIKVHTVRSSQSIGSFNRISWHCKGVGEVKRIQYEALTGSYRIWKLIDMH